ncbi:Secondary metabolism regulator LAE1 [Colletotrichum spinosum]|uniref:Secondary metabolism regulator LAE1 n=1 Tax=Colletotrichum spinosum TaxID=1347390 RepID=A0A4R8PM98_9PEZI|nr:Secondary metabolism regulator LAE1 [Colletotrichum spinosum]
MTDNSTTAPRATESSEPGRASAAANNAANDGGAVTEAANTAAAHGPELEAEPANEAVTDDDSSDRATSVASSSTSLASSILQHRLENGRTYHKYKDGKYLYPNDERENERLDLQHNLYLLTLNYKLGLAPPTEKDSGVKRVLDIGTGTGIWAMDFAEEHPEAEVLGVDLTPVQTKFVPPNATFEVDDVEQPWTYSKPFDYIHIRGMTSSISDWTKFLKQVYNGLAPGGYVELFEGHLRTQSDDGSLTPSHAISKWVDKLEEAFKVLGQAFLNVPDLIPMLKAVGFVDVTVVPFKWPIGPWPKDPHYKELGIWALENAGEGLEAWTMAALTRALGWSSAEVQLFIAEVRKEWKDRSIHHYCPIWVIYARRPEEDPK